MAQAVRDPRELAACHPYAWTGPKVVMVLDADALLSTIAYECRTGRRTRLRQVLESSHGRGFAPDHVFGEVYNGLYRFEAPRTTLDELRTCFEDHFLPLIRWVDTNCEQIVDPRVALVLEEDRTDLPTAQLASLIAPCLVVSGDKHLRRPGFAPDAWREALQYGTRVVDAANQQQGLALVGALPVVAIVGGGIKLGNKAGLPWWGSIGALSGIGFLVFRDHARRAAFAQRVGPLITELLRLVEESHRQVRDGVAGLHEVMLQPLSGSSARCDVARVMARAPEPMLITEIQAELGRATDTVPTTAEIRSLLTGREFVESPRHRWSIGRVSDPWSGAA